MIFFKIHELYESWGQLSLNHLKKQLQHYWDSASFSWTDRQMFANYRKHFCLCVFCTYKYLHEIKILCRKYFCTCKRGLYEVETWKNWNPKYFKIPTSTYIGNICIFCICKRGLYELETWKNWGPKYCAYWNTST